MKVQGACHCGQIRYEAEVDPERTAICHCTDCQVLTGTAFRVSVPANAGSFRLLAGKPTVYLKMTAESGVRKRHAFCPACGSPVYSTADEDHPASVTLRVGGLAQRAQLAPRRRIWCDSAVPWSQDVGGVPGIPRQ